MKFTYGKGQKIEGAELDKVRDQLLDVLKSSSGLIGKLSLNEIVDEWINDLLFLSGHAELDEVKPVEVVETEIPEDIVDIDTEEAD